MRPSSTRQPQHEESDVTLGGPFRRLPMETYIGKQVVIELILFHGDAPLRVLARCPPENSTEPSDCSPQNWRVRLGAA